MAPLSSPSTESTQISRRVARTALVGIIYMLVYLALDTFTRRFSLLPSVSPWYPPSGLSLGLVTIFGPAYAPWILVANLISNRYVWSLALGWDTILEMSVLPCLVYGLAGSFLRGRLGSLIRQFHARDVLVLGATSIIAPLPVALGAAFLGSEAGIVPAQHIGEAVRQLWVGDAIGIVIIVPFLLINLLPAVSRLRTSFTGLRPHAGWQPSPSAGRWLEAAVVLSGLGLLLLMIFRWEVFGDPPLVYPLFVPLIWVGLRFGLPGATVFVPVISVAVAMLSFPYAISGLDMVELQTFMVAYSVTGLLLGAVVSDQQQVNLTLSERETQYRQVFESTTDSLLVIDQQGQLLDFNPAAWTLFGHSRQTLVGLNLDDLLHFHPQEDETPAGPLNRLGRPSITRATAVRADGTTAELEVRMGALLDHDDANTLVVLHDITQEVLSRQQLEARVERRTRELSLLFDVSRAISASVEPDPPLDVILERMHRVVGFEAAWIRLLHEGYFEVRAAWPPSILHQVSDVPVDSVHGRTFSRIIAKRQVVEIASLEKPPQRLSDLAAGITVLSGDCLERPGAWMGIPLEVRGRQFGILELAHSRDSAFSPSECHLAEGFAQLAAVAVANAHLHLEAAERLEEAVRRTDVASGLREVLSALNSELPLDQVKQSIVDQAAALLGTGTIALYEVDPIADRLAVTASRGLPESFRRTVKIPVGQGTVGRILGSDHPITLAPARDRLQTDLLLLPNEQARLAYAQLLESHQAILAVPVRVRGEPSGGLFLYYREPRQITPEETSLAISFADQAALAIENNRLHAKALELAGFQERQKLARELHDSVSQALYGISLGAQTASTLLERDKTDAVREPLAYILGLAKTALTEMRALIFELRPDSLATEGLMAALQKQVESLASRHEIEVDTSLQDEPRVPLAIKECIYGVGREALHNITKHAQASHVTVTFSHDDTWGTLRVIDDGCGFSPGDSFPGHLGLISMHERAEGIGGKLQIESTPGQGTLIELRVPLKAPNPFPTS